MQHLFKSMQTGSIPSSDALIVQWKYAVANGVAGVQFPVSAINSSVKAQ